MALTSIIVPVYNAAPYLQMAVRSVLRQTVPVEIILVDDGSTDESAAIARRLASAHAEITLIEQPNRGVSSARNAGIARATGEFFGFLDADDEYTEGALAFLAHELEAHRRERGSLAMVRGKIRYLHSGPQRSWETRGEALTLTSTGPICACRAVIERVGGFDEELQGDEDTDWLLRAEAAGVAMPQLERVVLLYRQHEANATKNRALMQNERAKMIVKNARRRLASRKAEVNR